jgi:hypothetical protein
MIGSQYHSYRIFGEDNPQKSEKFKLNQLCKEKIILAYIMYAIAKTENPSFVELFCADGYFALAAKKFGAKISCGIDNGHKGYFGNAKKIAKHFNEDIMFLNMDVNDVNTLSKFDIVANVGGLYHTINPEEILKKSYDLAKKFLIVQTVVSLDPDDYFEASPKDRSWGSRFTKQYMDDIISEYNVIDSHYNELLGNNESKNRGSVYYLVQK